MNNFLEGLNILNSTFCVYALMVFKGASFNFELDFFNNKETESCKNYQRMYRKYLIYYYKPSKYIHLVPVTQTLDLR